MGEDAAVAAFGPAKQSRGTQAKRLACAVGSGVSAALFLEQQGTRSGPATPRVFSPPREALPSWKELFLELIGDGVLVEAEKLESLASLATAAEDLLQRLCTEAISVGVESDKLNKALRGRLLSDRPLPEASSALRRQTRVLPHHVLRVDDDHHLQGLEEPALEDQTYVKTTKFAYVMDRRTSSMKDAQAQPQPRQEFRRKRPDRRHSVDCLEEPTAGRCRTEPLSLGLQRRHSAQGPGLLICKHITGGPDLIYDMGSQVGEGTFGTVWRATHRRSGQVHVVKTVPKKLVPEGEIWAEVDMMRCLDHPHIMRLYYTFEDAKNIHIASEMCAGGELLDAILAARLLSEFIAARLFKQCLSAVSYLHFNSICHRDLKPENFLLSKKGDLTEVKVKLIDFGTAKRFDLGPMTTKVCTVSYVAPEVLKRNPEPYNEKVDVWSCGVMLFVMLSGSTPWNGTDDREVMKLIKKGKYAFEPASIWNKVSKSAQELIRHMMCLRVPDRHTATEAMQAHWFLEQEGQAEAAHMEELLFDDEVLAQMRSFVGSNKLKKVALQVIARSVSDDSIDKLREIFLSIDRDMSGSLSAAEVEEALKALDAPDSVVVEMQRILYQMDMDGSGDINWTEFLASTMKTQQYLQEEVCRAAFDMMDQDGDGIISRGDIINLLQNEQFGAEMNLLNQTGAEQADRIIESVDENGDGEVTFDEFMNMMYDQSEVQREPEKEAVTTA